MTDCFESLLVSCPNGGGLYFHHRRRLYRLDGLHTTGIALAGGGVVRALQPERLLLDCGRAVDIPGMPGVLLDLHDVHIDQDGVYVVSTGENTILLLAADGSEVRRWTFPGEGDAWHVNCVTRWGGRIVFSAFGEFAEPRGYKGRTQGAGFVRDLHSGEELIGGLSQPHSLVAEGENLWLANSESLEVRQYGPDGRCMAAYPVEGYPRGLIVERDRLLVGLSRSRNIIESDALQQACVLAIDRRSGQVLDRLDIPCAEVYALARVGPEDAAEVLARIGSQAASVLEQTIASLSARELAGSGAALVALGVDQALAELRSLLLALNSEIAGQIAPAVERTHAANQEQVQLLLDIRHELLQIGAGVRKAEEAWQKQAATSREELERAASRERELRLGLAEAERLVRESEIVWQKREADVRQDLAHAIAREQELRNDLAEARRRHAESEAAFRSKLEELERLGREKELAWQQRDAAVREELARAIAREEESTRSLQGALEACGARLREREKEMQGLIEQSAALGRELSDIRASMSWRLTAPFRSMRNLVKRN